jgi:hypothetical protein
MLHVGMNIADKDRLYREVRRVLKPGAVFGIYDVLQGPGGAPYFPVPWAAGAETSFLITAEALQDLLRRSGFEIAGIEDRSAFGMATFETMRQRIAGKGGPSPLGLHLLMGKDAPVKIANMIRSLQERRIAPTEVIARAV